MPAESVSQTVPRDNRTKRATATKCSLCPDLQPARPERLLPSWHCCPLQLRRPPDAGPPLRPELSSFTPVPLCGWHANCLEVPAHCRDKGLGGAAPGVLGTTQARKQCLARVPLLRHPCQVPQPREPSLRQEPPQRWHLAPVPQVLEAVAVSDAGPQKAPQAPAVRGL